MQLLDDENKKWYCFKDDEIYWAKENRWAIEKPKAAALKHSVSTFYLYSYGASGLSFVAFLTFGFPFWISIVGVILAIIAICKHEGKSAWFALIVSLAVTVFFYMLGMWLEHMIIF